MNARPVIVAGDRTHYLHSEEALVPGLEQRHILLDDGSEVSLYRWHAGDGRHPKAVLRIEHGPFAAYLNASAEQLRTMAYAMLQCASDIDAPPAAAPTSEGL